MTVLKLSMLFRALLSLAVITIVLFSPAQWIFSQSIPSQSTTPSLSISKRYLSYADSDIIISQNLENTLADSIQFFSESIVYDPRVVEFINVTNGAITPAPDWSIMKSVTAVGSVQISAVSSGIKLLGSGEILRLLFHVLDTAAPYATGPFSDSGAIFGSPGAVLSDTGMVRIITNCSSILTINGTPIALSAECIPNPATKFAAITYSLPAPAETVRISLYSFIGNEIQSLEFSGESAGTHEAKFDVADLPTGTYFYEIQADHARELRMLSIAH